ncbi:MAG: hypothetical protein L6Q76_31160 [Polyangiaceae bacterium]|nr:hypothetical protein [Polyangiaceae bacterium]
MSIERNGRHRTGARRLSRLWIRAVLGAAAMVSAAALLGGCPGTLTDEEKAQFLTGGGPVECGPIGPFLETNCGGTGCHGAMMPASNLDLVSPGVDERVADKTSLCGGLLANTSDPQASVIYTKLLKTPPCGARMPFFRDPLSDEQAACILTWLEGIEPGQGAGGMGGSGGMGGGAGGMGGMGGAGGN